MTRIFLLLIRLYQLVVSPVFVSLGAGCRFYPSCSEYAKIAYQKHSVFGATRMVVWRLMRCNRLINGGLDTVA